MALKSTRIAGVELTIAGGDVLVHEVPASKHSGFKLFVTNRNDTEVAKIDVAVTSGGTPTASDYIRYKWPLPPEDTLEIPNLGLEEAQRLYVKSDQDLVNAVVIGIVEDLAA